MEGDPYTLLHIPIVTAATDVINIRVQNNLNTESVIIAEVAADSIEQPWLVYH